MRSASAALAAVVARSPNANEAVRWIDLKPVQLAQQVLVRGYQISRNTAAKLLVQAIVAVPCAKN